MKAIVIHQYGPPNVLKYEDYDDPIVGSGEILLRVSAAAVNPIDLKKRSGAVKEIFPIKFPGVLGYDVSGTITKLGSGVQGLAVGDKVLAFADHTYAELCAVPAMSAAKVSQGLDLIDAAALPVAATTGYQLITKGTAIKPGQRILVVGAVGGVGRVAVYMAKHLGAVVIAGVLKRQLEAAKSLGVSDAVALDDDTAIQNLATLDAVADTVGGKTTAMLMGKIAKGGVFASVVGPPANAKEYPSVRVAPIYSHPDATILAEMAQAAANKNLVLPIGMKFPLKNASEAHAAIEKGGAGKVLLVV